MSAIFHKCESGGSMNDQTDVNPDSVLLQPPAPPGPGLLEVKLLDAYRLSLPADPKLGGPEQPSAENPRPNMDVSKRYRWRPYVIAEYEGIQMSVEATHVYLDNDRGEVSWPAGHQLIRFEASASPSSELTLSLSARDKMYDPSTSMGGYEQIVVPLGFIRFNPFEDNGTWGMGGVHSIDIQNGTGRLEVQVRYTRGEVAPLEEREVWETRHGPGHDGIDLVYIEKKDTGRSYGMELVRNGGVDPALGARSSINMAPGLSLSSGIRHPFIAPLKFAFHSPEGGMNLLSPLGSGGYFFDHVQKERRFDVEKACFYAAELVCMLEYLHTKRIFLASLKPQNLLLDSSGHISLCRPSLFALEYQTVNSEEEDHIMPSIAEYPAPETLLDSQTISGAVDWWAVGILLHEMLIDIPPFHHKDNNRRQRRIISEELQLPETLPLICRDLLHKLLDKDPLTRLGANGATDVKAHPFFHNVKWNEITRRNDTTPFKPHDAETIFWRKPARPVYKTMDYTGWLAAFGYPPDTIQQRRKKWNARREALLNRGEDDNWDLVWDPTALEFHFKNRLTDEKAPAQPKPVTYKGLRYRPPSPPERPSERQKRKALGAALQAGYSKRVVLQALEYGPDLNSYVLEWEQTPDDRELLDGLFSGVPLTPLESAIEYERPDLVTLFLDKGADTNRVPAPRGNGDFFRQGPALLKAVRKRNYSLVEILVRKTTNRLCRIRALALAAEMEDITTATILLAHGVYCDFEESDRPLPDDPRASWDYDSVRTRTMETWDFTPPLVRAARLGNVGLVKLLLKHGANPNIPSHVLGGRGRPLPVYGFERTDVPIPAGFSCGRAWEIAMEMGHSEVVRLLLDAGADINLKHDVWPKPAWPVPGHICQPVPRAVYVEVRSGLEAAVAARKEGKYS